MKGGDFVPFLLFIEFFFLLLCPFHLISMGVVSLQLGVVIYCLRKANKDFVSRMCIPHRPSGFKWAGESEEVRSQFFFFLLKK